MDGDSQIECLKATATRVACGKGAAHLAENVPVRSYVVANHERAGLFERLEDALAAGYLADTRVARAIREDDDVPREPGGVSAAQVEQHAVFARNGDYPHGDDNRRSGRRGHAGHW
jgi:hypothetical protein